MSGTDRELLELAAQAAGFIEFTGHASERMAESYNVRPTPSPSLGDDE